MKKMIIGLVLYLIYAAICYFPRETYGFWSVQYLLTSFVTFMTFAWIFHKLTKPKS